MMNCVSWPTSEESCKQAVRTTALCVIIWGVYWAG